MRGKTAIPPQGLAELSGASMRPPLNAGENALTARLSGPYEMLQ